MEDCGPPPGFESADSPPGFDNVPSTTPSKPVTNQNASNKGKGTNTKPNNGTAKGKANTAARTPKERAANNSNPKSPPNQRNTGNKSTNEPRNTPNAAKTSTNPTRQSVPKKDNLSSGTGRKEDLQPFGAPEKQVTEEPCHPYFEESQELCLTCCNPIRYFAVGECNHRSICGLCVIRMRSLHDDTNCPLCKVNLKEVVFTKDPSKPFQELDYSKMIYGEECKGYFEDKVYYDEIKSLFETRCPMCNVGFKTLNQLSKHVKDAHKLQYCVTCLNHHKVFLKEKVLYTPELLEKHKLNGDKLFNIKPHPICDYCKSTFFSEEELYIHCKEKHETCFICDRQGVSLQYFKDYSHLETHFRRKHFLCEDNLCKQLKFVVFSSQFELQAHNVSVHYGMRLNHLIRVTQLDKMTKEQKALARTVEVNFTVRRERDPSPTRSTDSTALSFAHHDVGPVKPATPIAVAKNPEELTREERTSRNVALRKKIMVFLKNDNQRFVNFSHQNDAAGRSLFEEFVALLPDPVKRRQLLEQAQKAQQIKSEFPSLGGDAAPTSPSLPMASGVYRNAAGGRSVSPEAFPSLSSISSPPSVPTTVVASRGKKKGGRGGANAVGGGRGVIGGTPVRSADLFPSLPPAGQGFRNNPYFSNSPTSSTTSSTTGIDWAGAASRGRGRGRGGR